MAEALSRWTTPRIAQLGTRVRRIAEGRAMGFDAIAGAIVADQGGADRCSETRQQLIRRFAAVAVLAEQMEATLANGAKIDVAEYCALASAAVRIAARVGIDRRSKSITPSLRDYLEGRAAVEEPAEEDAA